MESTTSWRNISYSSKSLTSRSSNVPDQMWCWWDEEQYKGEVGGVSTKEWFAEGSLELAKKAFSGVFDV